MAYLFSALLLINSYLYITKGSWFFICFIASIVALTCVIKVKPRSGFYLFAVAAFSSVGFIFSIVHILDYGFRSFIAFTILSLFFLIYIAMCIQEEERITKTYGSVKQYKYLKNHPVEVQISKPTKREYKIDTVRYFKEYFDIIDKYHSAYDQGLLDDPEDGVYPLYDYKKLDCKLEQTEDTKYHVYVATDRGWAYAGYIDRTSFLDDDIENMKSWYVKASGGSTYIVSGGKYEKTWQPLHFTLVIDLRDADE